MDVSHHLSMPLSSIGTVHSPFRDPLGTPVQNYAARIHEGGGSDGVELHPRPHTERQGGRGTLEIDPEWEEGLIDLEGCDRIWILFWVHRAAAARTMVVPYRDTVARGVFSTRAPARPNPIGLSCVRLLGVRGRFVHVAELDALDGSPLLDIKPYVAEYDAFPGSTPAWLGSPTAIPGPMLADGRFEGSLR